MRDLGCMWLVIFCVLSIIVSLSFAYNEGHCFFDTHYPCGNGYCVDILGRCDGVQDCSNGHDEDDCPPKSCSSDQFKCEDNQCISSEYECNDIFDCEDHSDEKNCYLKSCSLGEFRCGNYKQCISSKYVCNGIFDCKDHSDEISCNKESDEEQEYNSLRFDSCVLPKWTCVNKTVALSSKIDSITYECDAHTSAAVENRALDLSRWQDINVRQLTVRGCGGLTLKMHTVAPTTIDSLIIQDILKLVIERPSGEATHHSREVTLKNIGHIPVLPSQMISNSNTQSFRIIGANIDLIEPDAIKPEGKLQTFLWNRVETKVSIQEKALSVTMDKNGRFIMKMSKFPILMPLAIFINGESPIVIKNSKFKRLQAAAIVANVPSFLFQGNEIMESSQRMSVQAPKVIFEGNTFAAWETHADLLEWTVHYESMPQYISFWFVDNYVIKGVDQPPAPREKPLEKFNHGCISSVKFYNRSKNNSEVCEQPGSDVYKMSSWKTTVLNTFICKNYLICEESMTEDCSNLILNNGEPYNAWDPLRHFTDMD